MVAAAMPVPAVAAGDENVVISVGQTHITQQEFEQQVAMAARSQFYHARPANEAAYRDFRRSVAEKLIERHLLLEEARRKGIQANEQEVAATLDSYERRFRDTERWQIDGEQMLASLRHHFEEESQLAELQRLVQGVDAPSRDELIAYYQGNQEIFTEPPQNRVSVILLAVDPSAGQAAWDAATSKAREVIRRLSAGEDFGELASAYSSDRSSGDGGDMGYLHAGMLSPAAEAAINSLPVGGVSDPVTVLEGVAIFRLEDRREARLLPFADVEHRAGELWRREQSRSRWAELVSTLRAKGQFSIDERYFAMLPAAAH